MNQEQRDAAAMPFAAEVVEQYARRALPAMSGESRRVLLNHLTRRLAMVMHVNPIGDWAEGVNAALDEWEDQARTAGPRVEAFDDTSGGVTIRMRADT